MDVIEIKGVSKKFGEKIVLENVSFNIAKGDIFGIVGASGSGKSVLIKILIGFLEPDVGGVNISGKVGFSMQYNSIYDNLTVRQNLNYFSKIYEVKERRQKIDFLIRALFLEEYEDVLVSKLSGGTKKRVDIACSLLNSPDILILDEPFAGLDSLLIASLTDFFNQLNQKGTTIIFSSHLLNHARDFCKKVAFISQGKARLISPKQLEGVYS